MDELVRTVLAIDSIDLVRPRCDVYVGSIHRIGSERIYGPKTWPVPSISGLAC